jgi:Uma2 family endonuclease
LSHRDDELPGVESMATVRHRIGPADHGRKMTLEEFWEAEEQPGHLYELARGVLEVSEVPGDSHDQVVDNLHEAFSTHRRLHPNLILRIGHGSDVRYIIPELGTDWHPDLAVVFRGEMQRDFRGRLLPVLGVEIVSAGSRARQRDYVDKREDYLAVGLLEYWIVDPELRQVTVLARREVDGVTSWEGRTFRDGAVIASELLPEFVGTVAELWADADDED